MLKLKLQYFGHLVWSWLIRKDPDAGKNWRQEEKGMTGDKMVGWHHWLNGYEFEQALGVGDRQGSLVCCSPWDHRELDHKESDMTEWLNWTDMYHNFFIHSSVHGQLGCFHVLAIVNSAAMNNGIHVSSSILVPSGYMPRSGIPESYGGFSPYSLP